MVRSLSWNEVKVGDDIPSLAKIATTQTLVKWAGASGDFNPLHFDPWFAQRSGNERPIIHGALKRQWLIQLLTDWTGDVGALRKFSCRYRAMDFPRHMKSTSEPEEGETWTCKGRVTRKYVDLDQQCLDCEVWVENGSGEKTTSGKATCVITSRI
jgi:hypothetical protein